MAQISFRSRWLSVAVGIVAFIASSYLISAIFSRKKRSRRYLLIGLILLLGVGLVVLGNTYIIYGMLILSIALFVYKN